MQIQEEDLRGMNDYIYGPQRSSIQPLFEIDSVGGRLRYARQGLLSDDCDEIVEEIFAWWGAGFRGLLEVFHVHYDE